MDYQSQPEQNFSLTKLAANQYYIHIKLSWQSCETSNSFIFLRIHFNNTEADWRVHLVVSVYDTEHPMMASEIFSRLRVLLNLRSHAKELRWFLLLYALRHFWRVAVLAYCSFLSFSIKIVYFTSFWWRIQCCLKHITFHGCASVAILSETWLFTQLKILLQLDIKSPPMHLPHSSPTK